MNGATSTGTVSITLVGSNDAPTANDDTATTDEDYSPVAPGAVPIIANIFANDFDPDDANLILKSFSTTSQFGATVSINAAGVVTYDPRFAAALQSLPPGQTIMDKFTYEVVDSLGLTDTATVTVKVNGTNDAPQAVGDAYRVDEDSTLIVSGAGVLGNDFDPDATDVITVGTFDVTSAQGVPVSVNPNGTFSYDPTTVAALQQLALGQSVTDTFTYRVSDGQTLSNTAIVTITIDGRNDAPTVGNDTYSVDEEQTLTVAATLGVLANDSDLEGSPLWASMVTGASNGRVVLNSSGSFTYTPNANFSGRDSFTYLAGDGSSTSSGTVTLNVRGVNDSPTAFADEYTVDEGGSLSVTAANGVLANDVDVDQETLQAVYVNGSGTANGSLSFNANGSFTYTPNIGFFGTDTFRYMASDGASSSIGRTVTFNVRRINEPPTIVVPGRQTFFTHFDNLFTSTPNPFQISDVKAGNSNVQVDLTIGDGAVTLANSTGVTVTQNPGGNNGIRITGSVANINTALGHGVNYRTSVDGNKTLNAVVNDLGNTGGNQLTATARVAVEVLDFVPVDIIGSVFIDEDGDGQKDPDEPGIEGVHVLLTGTDFQGNAVSRPAITDVHGEYSFLGLRPNAAGQPYTLTQEQPAFIRGGGQATFNLDALGNIAASERVAGLRCGWIHS